MKKVILSILSILGVLAVSVAVVFGLNATKKAPEKKEGETPKTLVEVTTASSQTISFSVHSQGTVAARTETTLFPEVSGEITYVSPALYAGGFFEAGEVLLRIDPSNYEVALKSAQAQLARAKVTLLREKALAEQALKDWVAIGNREEEASTLVLREPQLLEAEANIQSAQAALQKAERDLRKTAIIAPYEGMVRERYADLGQFVTPNASLARVFATDYAEVRLSLTADDLRFLDLPHAYRDAAEASKPEPEVVLTSRFGGMNETWVGKVVRTEGTIDPRTRVMYAVVRVEDPYGKHNVGSIPLSIGMFVEASIAGKTYEHVVKLPRYVMRGDSMLLVVDGENALRRRSVETLRSDSEWVYIQSGIEEGERICLTALEFVVEGMPVEPVDSSDDLALAVARGNQFSLN
jgi:RND family efflux transporter MFP subunit